MAHKIARLMLENAGTFLERTEAIQTAHYLGMPLQEIEEYLDWLDLAKSKQEESISHKTGCPEGPPHRHAG